MVDNGGGERERIKSASDFVYAGKATYTGLAVWRKCGRGLITMNTVVRCGIYIGC